MRKITQLIGQPMILMLLLSSMQTNLHAQNVAKRITASNGDFVPFLQYLPAGHSAPGNTRKYPLIIFLHGGGERSDDASLSPGSPVWKLEGINNTNGSVDGFGPSRLVRLGHKMNFTWNGQTDSCAVISPMSRLTKRTAPNQGSYINVWPLEYVEAILAYATDTLKIDTNRIYLTGLSYGGGGTFNFLNSSLANVKKLAAAAPICAWLTGLNSNGHSYVANANLPLWGFHAVDDPTTNGSYTVTQNSINGVNALNPPTKALITLWPDGAHYIWPRVYNIDYPVYAKGYDGVLNIYEWFLGQNNDSAANVLPVANAGNDIVISPSPGTATLDGSASTDADGTIVRYVWRKIGGPAGGTIATPFGTASSTTISGLTTVGVYTYQLNVVDHRAAIARDTVSIIVGDTTGNGKALRIDSIGGRIIAGNISQLKNSAAFTVEAQFKFDSYYHDWSDAEALIFRSNTTTTDRIRLYIDKATMSVRFIVANGTDARGYTANNVISHDTWHQVAAVFDGAGTYNKNRMKIYINGVPQTLSFTDTIPTVTSNTNTSCIFGSEFSNSKLTYIDEVRVWDTVVAPNTIDSWKAKLLGSCHPNVNRLKVYWPLNIDTNAAKAVAVLGTSYPGNIFYSTYVPTHLPVDTTPCVVDSGHAVSINSIGGRIIAGNISQLKNASAFTIEAQFRYDGYYHDWSDAEALIFRSNTTTTDRIRLYIDKATRSIRFIVANGTDARGYTGSNVISHDTWHHVAAVFDGAGTYNKNRLKLYVDGIPQVLTFTDTIPVITSNTTPSCLFGSDPSASRLTYIDEVRVWNAVVDSAAINAWKNKQLGDCHPNFSNLKVYWPLDVDTNAAVAVAALGTSYPGVIFYGSYVTSYQTAAPGDCPELRIAQLPAAIKTPERIPVYGRVYPNPTNGLVQLEMHAPVSRSVRVNVIDLFGRYVLTNQRPLAKGNNWLSVNIASLPAGTYLIEVKDGKGIREQYKVLKR